MVSPADMPLPYGGPPLHVGWIGNYRHPWCSEMHFTQSMESLGHHVERWQEDELDWSTVVPMVERLGLQAVFWTRTWPADISVVLPVLAELRAIGVVSCSVHLDRWFGLDRQHQVDDQPFFRTDLVLSPDDSPLWPEHGVNHFWLPPGVYGPECEPVAPNPRRWPYDVVFVGSHPYPHPEWAKYRSDLLSAFSRAFRGRFGVLPRRGVPIRGQDLQELYATVPVVLGDSCLAGESHRYWSDRVPETLGRGGLLIHPMVDGMTPWYDGGDAVHFEGYDLWHFNQAVELAKTNLASPERRERISRDGRATVLSRDTYAHRMGTVLAVAEGIHGGYRDVTPAERPKVPDLMANLEASLAAARSTMLQPPPREFEYIGNAVVDVPPTPRHSVQLHRWSAIFEPRPGTTDSEVIGEVWRNDYKVPPGGFSGTVVDIGANIGAFSVLAAKAGAKRVLAFEPERENNGRLWAHMTLNDLENRIVPIREAVTAGGDVLMVGTGGGARSVDYPSTGGVCSPEPVWVPGITLESVLDGYGPVEFLKCDIEGGEYEAFAACPVEALANVQTIALEFHGPAMPHLTHLDDGKHLERWGALVAKLADAGRVETFGHPMRGGLIWWKRYGA